MTRMRHRLIPLAALAIAAVATATAVAATGTDPDDATGKLDLKTIGGTVKSGLVTFKVGTYEALDPAVLKTGFSNLIVLFDTNGDDEIDYRAKIVVTGKSQYVARLSGHGKKFEPIPLKRAGKTLSGTFPADVLGDGSALRIAATSLFKTCACGTPNNDRAPDAGWIDVG